LDVVSSDQQRSVKLFAEQSYSFVQVALFLVQGASVVEEFVGTGDDLFQM
jgi:hypothetical protein